MRVRVSFVPVQAMHAVRVFRRCREGCVRDARAQRARCDRHDGRLRIRLAHPNRPRRHIPTNVRHAPPGDLVFGSAMLGSFIQGCPMQDGKMPRC